MPIIAIFTKYDKLVDHFFFLDSSVTGLDEAKARAKARLNELCVKPFKEQIVKKNIPEIPVSSECDNLRRPIRILTVNLCS